MTSSLSEVVTWLHRDPELYVVFGNKKESLRNIGKMQVKDFDSLPIKTKSRLLSANHYFTPNSFSYQNPTQNKGDYEGLFWAVFKARTKDKLQRLNAFFVDLDLGREQDSITVTVEQAVKELPEFLSCNNLPMYSAIAKSGRGLYVFWLICGETEPSLGERANKSNQELYKEIQKRLVEVFSRYNADGAVVTGNQFLRIPGSFHSVAKKEVCYYLEESEAHTLREMASILDVPVIRAKPQNERETKNKGSCPNRKNGYMQRYKDILSDIDKLVILRPVRKRAVRYAVTTEKSPQVLFQSRGRKNFLEIVTWCHKALGYTKSETIEALKLYSKFCVPVYPSDPEPDDVPLETLVRGIFNNPKSKYTWTCDGLADHFGVSEALARRLELKQICPDTVKQERKREERQRVAKAKMELLKIRNERLNIIQGAYSAFEEIPTLAKLSKILVKHGHDVRKETLRRYCFELGLELNDRGRPSKDVGQLVAIEKYRKAS